MMPNQTAMSDQDVAKRRHESHRGDQAQAILDNPLFNESFEAVEQELMTRWKTDPSLAPEGRERVFLMVTLLGQVRQHLTMHMQTGRMAAEQLKVEKTRLERLKTGLRSIRR
jgi:hypothetical protein